MLTSLSGGTFCAASRSMQPRFLQLAACSLQQYRAQIARSVTYCTLHRPRTLQACSGLKSLVLGIETSCDDTGVAIVNNSGQVLGDVIVSQVDIHAAYGGVVPNLAMEAHKAAMDNCVQNALQQAGVAAGDLQAISVSIGPGLSPCLHVGVKKAHQLAHQHGLPLVPVHHMEAHALVGRLGADVQFPFLCMLVSGGHNMLLVAHAVGDYTLMGSTLDDSVGEAFDKIARLLGLKLHPNGGAALEAFARKGDPHKYPFTVPLRLKSDCNFSYAGLKNSVRLAIQAEAPGDATAENEQIRADIAASFQRVAITHLTERCRRAAAWAKESHPELQTLVVAGGVACNQMLRQSLDQVAQEADLTLVCPPARLCTDNGVMVAWAGIERLQLGLCETAQPDPDTALLDVRPRWPLTDRRDSRSMPNKKSMRKSRIFTSLTDLTAEALQLQRQGKAAATVSV